MYVQMRTGDRHTNNDIPARDGQTRDRDGRIEPGKIRTEDCEHAIPPSTGRTKKQCVWVIDEQSVLKAGLEMELKVER